MPEDMREFMSGEIYEEAEEYMLQDDFVLQATQAPEDQEAVFDYDAHIARCDIYIFSLSPTHSHAVSFWTEG